MGNIEVIKSDSIRKSGCLIYAIFGNRAMEINDIIGVHEGKSFNVRPVVLDGRAVAVINNGRLELLCMIMRDGHWKIGTWPRPVRDAREIC